MKQSKYPMKESLAKQSTLGIYSETKPLHMYGKTYIKFCMLVGFVFEIAASYSKILETTYMLIHRRPVG